MSSNMPPQLEREEAGRSNWITSKDRNRYCQRGGAKNWQSIEEGPFENRSGNAKPMNLNINPHVDPAEDTLYRILSRNNCAPERVELNKGIRSDIVGG
ncbi:dnaJ-like protein [Artemisia annua]|uniref:DnaJ-like protein n=1 Tax=Artemisia annua TaxID=35608 RepID=A0A2U1MUW6_ARTAN|nr:dnaJ-like protein [Artemisia annua]